MHLLSASSLGSTGKEAVPLETAWNGYRQVLKGRFHRGTTQLRKAATAAEADRARYAREVPLTARAREVLDELCPAEGIIFPKFAWRYPLRTAALSAHSAPELRRKPYLSTFGFRKEGVCRGYQPHTTSSVSYDG